ncbi:MAG TPA: M20/M25/M40 family metallo-hydrolase, partial [Herpetosiphonaceae bacterium]|nr:M20/M25/M40 family metallo-hydrolase [Herpetosiphonaceae bacterium]
MSLSSASDEMTMYRRPVELLQQLIRFDTTNPPGNEAACIGYISALLRAQGIEPLLLARDPARPNLVARIAGEGTAPPLLLYGHVDVVTTAEQTWQHPPFAGVVAGGYVWGRGALDMKGGVAMLLASFLRAKAEGLHLPGDVVLVMLVDEEAGGDNGAQYLVEHHAGLFADMRYALGEFGGFSMELGGRRFYPVQVAEKQICWMRATVRGRAGHGSLPLRGGAMAKLGHLLRQLDRHRLPVHITPVARRMIELIAAALPLPGRVVLGQLLNPALTDGVLRVLGAGGTTFDPLLHNTVNATIVRGGDKINVIPSTI